MKRRRDSKTIWVNSICLAVLIALAAAQKLSFVAPNADLVLALGTGITIVNILLREFTTQGIKR